jgi:CBS domain-containing protein
MKVRRRAPRVVSVRDLMNARVVTAVPDERVGDVAARMWAGQVGAAAVMEGDRLVGILTERDLLRAIAEGLSPPVTPVSTCMTADPVWISPDERASAASARMVELHVRHLPVVDDGRVVGFISARDLLGIRGGVQADLAALAFEPW